MLPYIYEQVKHLPHFPFSYGGSKEVPASSDGGSGLIQFKIINNCHFLTRRIRLSYNTLDAEGADDGVTHLSAILKGTQQPFFKDYQPLENIAVPGRQRTAGVDGDPGNAIHTEGLHFEVFWSANDNVILDLKNDIDFIQTCKMTLIGWHFPIATFEEPRP